MPDLGEFLVIGIVALMVIPPERLPQAARTLGQWIGRMQNYVTQMRTEVDRELHLADLRRIGEEARAGARSVESALQGTVSGVQADLNRLRSDFSESLSNAGWAGGPPPMPTSFPRRYRPRPSIDDLTREIERLKQGTAPSGGPVNVVRSKYAPRARVNRVRVRR